MVWRPEKEASKGYSTVTALSYFSSPQGLSPLVVNPPAVLLSLQWVWESSWTGTWPVPNSQGTHCHTYWIRSPQNTSISTLPTHSGWSMVSMVTKVPQFHSQTTSWSGNEHNNHDMTQMAREGGEIGNTLRLEYSVKFLFILMFPRQTDFFYSRPKS